MLDELVERASLGSILVTDTAASLSCGASS